MTTTVAPALVLSPEVIDFLEGGRITFLASRGPDRTSECVLASAIRVDAGGTTVRVYVPRLFAEVTLANLADNGQLAVTATHVVDSRSVQLKGEAGEIHAATPLDRAEIEAPIEALRRELALVGMPRAVTMRVVHFPSVCISMRVRELYDQTPGPHAGSPLASRGVGR